MTDTIENPTADQLEAGGKVSGFAYNDLFTFTDKVIRDGKYGRLYIAGTDNGNTATVRYPDGRIPSFITITSYTPPAPAWDLQDDLAALLNRYCAENVSGTPDFILAEMLTGFLREFNGAVSKRAEWRGESTELPALIDTTPVPRDALDKLREAVHTTGLYNTELSQEACRFLAAVDAGNES